MKKRFFITLLVFFIPGFTAYRIWILKQRFFQPNINCRESCSLFIPSGSNYDSLLNILSRDSLLLDIDAFQRVAKTMKYGKKIYPGHYRLTNNMNNRQLIHMLRSGLQTPVKVTFTNIRTIEQLAGKIAKQIEADSLSLLHTIRDTHKIREAGFETHTFIAMFIPNTYELYWTTSAEMFFSRMYKEYQRFWNSSRLSKAQAIKLSPIEVGILASIVDQETSKTEEMPMIAGVYINRLQRRIRLGADPTIRFLLSDSIKRVLTRHLSIESPYNTYRYYGLPPGPISCPSVAAIDAVLNYKKHDYLYFCAKEDFSGYHYFAKTLAEHNRYAKLYQHALNKKKIWK